LLCKKRYDHPPPCLCDKVVPQLILFFRNYNNNNKISKASRGPPCHINKVVKNYIFK
jgi:hypothetical protein